MSEWDSERERESRKEKLRPLFHLFKDPDLHLDLLSGKVTQADGHVPAMTIKLKQI